MFIARCVYVAQSPPAAHSLKPRFLVVIELSTSRGM
jgi:hypothetical protein